MDSPAPANMSRSVSDALDAVNRAAQADTTGTGRPHLALLESIQKYKLAVEKPGETLTRHRFELLQNVAVRMALEAGLLQAIGQANGSAVTAETLAKRTGLDTLLITRIMRLVTYEGFCEELSEDTYGANEVTHLFNTPAMSGAERHHYDLFFPIGAVLPKYIRETGVHQFPERPEDKSPFQYGHNMTLWEFMEKHPEDRKDFDNYMSGRREGFAQWYEIFPMSSRLGRGAKYQPGAVLLVDVGGNKGHDIAGFHKAHPEVPGRLILQELEPMIETVRKNPPDGVELMAYDFFTPQPVRGARAYYFRNVCHDWSDSHCKTILTNTANAMEYGYSRILLDEFVLPNTGASLRGAGTDVLMMMYASGIERTLAQWQRLLEACDLEIVKVWGLDSGYEQVIECQLKTRT